MGVVAVLLAEDTERGQHEVDLGVTVEHIAEHLLVALWIQGIEGHRLDGRRSGVAEPLDGRSQLVGAAGRQHDRPATTGDEPVHGLDGDVGTAAEHQHRLHPTQRVSHGLNPFRFPADRPVMGASPIAHRNLGSVSTRMLIILALVCGLLIIAAFAIQIFVAT